MSSLSLCMIVKDEGAFLEQCLNSVKELVDEIIIVDTGSSDNTKEIAAKFTDKVFDLEWKDDFSAARNFSLSKATKDWILVLDADELINKEDFEKIKKLIEDNSVEGYALTQRNYTNNSALLHWVPCENSKGFSGYRPSRLVRLFRNNEKYRYKNKVHELVEYSIDENKGKIVRIDLPIHHYGETREEYIKKKKGEKYFKLGEAQISENPNDARAYYETGIGCMIQNDFQKAIGKFEKVVEINPGYKDVYYNLGSAYHSAGQMDKAEAALKKSIEKKPNVVAAHNLLGKILYDKKQVKSAIDVLFKGLKTNKREVLLYKTIGGMLVNMKKPDQAIKILEAGLKLAPRDVGMYMNLGGAYLIKQDFDNAIVQLNQALALNPMKFDIHKNLFIVLMHKGEKDKAIKVLENAKKIFPKYKEVLEELAKVNKL